MEAWFAACVRFLNIRNLTTVQKQRATRKEVKDLHFEESCYIQAKCVEFGLTLDQINNL